MWARASANDVQTGCADSPCRAGDTPEPTSTPWMRGLVPRMLGIGPKVVGVTPIKVGIEGSLN